VEAKAISDYGLTLVNTANAGALKIALSLGTMADETATDYLTKAGNLSGLIDVATARTNLGLGTMAVEAAATYPTKANNLSDLASVVTARVNLDLRGQEPLAILTSADLNTTSDQAIPLPTGSYIIDNVIFTNASATPTVAAGGVYTSSAKGGTQIVANSQLYTSLSSATKYLDATLHADTATTTYSGSLYLSLTTAEGSALTADVYVYGKRLR
jgi:hypothetical protein